MKKIYSYMLLIILFSMINVEMYAYDLKDENVDGVTIYYNYINDGKELEVTDGIYSGIVVIPEEVTYMNRTRKVTSIGDFAFYGCSGLTSVTIPNNVTSIGNYTFKECSRLTSVTIGNSVKSIGDEAFSYCRNLASVYISDLEAWCGILFTTWESNPLCFAHHLYMNGNEITNLVIPDNVTSIGQYGFGGSDLTSLTIDNGVKSIGDMAFGYCRELTSVTIGNSVKSIGEQAFYECNSLTSVTIGNSVTSIGDQAFYECNSLTSVTIGNNVKSIGDEAFSGCSGLTSVTIPNSVTSIGDKAFSNSDIPEVISKIKNPFNVGPYVFSQNTILNATLYVPIGTIEKYKNKEGWKEFMYIEEGTPNCIEQVHSKAKLIQCESGILTVQNVKDDTPINVYTTNGTMVGSTISQNGHATISTNLQQGTVTIIKIGDKSIKTIIK